MNEKPITTLGPWSYHNPIDMAADEQSFSINKEVKWMNEIDKRIEKIEKGTPVYDCQGIIVCYTENDTDKAWLIDSYKKCREDYNILSSLYEHLRVNTEQRTKEACFKAGWAWIQDDFGEQFGYEPTDDTDKEDFKQAIDEAKIEQHLECI